MKKYLNFKLWLVLLTVAFVLQTVLLGAVIVWARTRIHDLDRDISTNSIQTSIATSNGTSLPAIADVSQNKVFIPALRLALPLNDETLAIVYSKTGDKQVSISNKDALSVPYDVKQQRDCKTLIRIVEEPKVNSFNPSDKHVKTLTLSDGRTLQLYANVPKSCQPTFQTARVDPEKFAKLFDDATSY